MSFGISSNFHNSILIEETTCENCTETIRQNSDCYIIYGGKLVNSGIISDRQFYTVEPIQKQKFLLFCKKCFPIVAGKDFT